MWTDGQDAPNPFWSPGTPSVVLDRHESKPVSQWPRGNELNINGASFFFFLSLSLAGLAGLGQHGMDGAVLSCPTPGQSKCRAAVNG